jgi:hypothetical protein
MARTKKGNMSKRSKRNVVHTTRAPTM